MELCEEGSKSLLSQQWICPLIRLTLRRLLPKSTLSLVQSFAPLLQLFIRCQVACHHSTNYFVPRTRCISHRMYNNPVFIFLLYCTILYTVWVLTGCVYPTELRLVTSILITRNLNRNVRLHNERNRVSLHRYVIIPQEINFGTLDINRTDSSTRPVSVTDVKISPSDTKVQLVISTWVIFGVRFIIVTQM
jgi:hypothetical protein